MNGPLPSKVLPPCRGEDGSPHSLGFAVFRKRHAWSGSPLEQHSTKVR